MSRSNRPLARVAWPDWLRARRASLPVTGLALVAALFSARIPFAPARIQLASAGLLIVSLFVFVFQPQIRAAAASGKATALVLFLAAAGGFAAMIWLPRPQEHRLVTFPVAMWWAIAALLALAALGVWLVSLNPGDPPSRSIARSALALLIVLGAALALLHVVSVGRFMRFDMPDEPIVASSAVNLALHGRFTLAYDGDIYGYPDPSVARYYWLMGKWLALAGSTDLVTLRVFPLAVGAAASAIAALALWQISSFSLLQRLTGLVVLLALSPFVRTSHNLRADIGLAVYGALVLLAQVRLSEPTGRPLRWHFLMGVALFVGLETIPNYALAFAVALGLLELAWAADRSRRRIGWRPVAAYAAGCALAGLGYAAFHFLPDISGQFGHWQDFVRVYADDNAHRAGSARGTLRYFWDFSTTLSPAELPLIAAGVIGALRGGSRLDRRLAALVLAGLLVAIYPQAASYGYLVLIAPFLAILVASLCRAERRVMIVVFALAPALVAAPLLDLGVETKANDNELLMSESALLTWQIPEGSTVVGDDRFWLTLSSEGRDFIGRRGVHAKMMLDGVDLPTALERLAVSAVICRENTPFCDEVGHTPLFAPPVDFTVTDGNYLLYRR